MINKTAKRILTGPALSLVLLAVLLAGCAGKPAITSTAPTFEVTKGDFDIIVSTDGYLTMPNEYQLKFGVSGQVDQILVEEGEEVRQGSVLATLDNKSQKNAIKTALFNIQYYQDAFKYCPSCSTGDCTYADHLPFNYPDLSIARMLDEAQSDITRATDYFKQGNYKDAGYRLIMTYFDIQVCEDLIREKPDYAALAGTDSIKYTDPNAITVTPGSPYNTMVIAELEKYRAKLLDISQQMKAGDYAKILPGFNRVQQEMSTVSSLAKSTIDLKSRMIFEYPDAPSSADFLQSSMRSLQDLQDYLARPDADAVEAAKKLYIAKLNLLVGKEVLENQKLVFESWSTMDWKKLQQYNLDLQAQEIALYKAKQDIMKTVIIAPSDGNVVSVDLKKSSVLSSQDYSTRTAVRLVDISTIKFEGTIDEVDITRVKQGQKANITIDALPGRTFTGTVRFVSPYGVQTGKVIKFATTILLDPYEATLKGGLSATAKITTYSAKDVMLVPVSVVVHSATRGTVVAVIGEGMAQPEFRKVTVGQQNLQFAEILSGLEPGEKVTISTASPDAPQPPNQASPPPGTGVPQMPVR
ncbi:MAG: efflux RND transporter periplasmic adaptor subunit [Dehalococcoidia bacterium]|nr:efflux RND transporter periplasmic adaptor subunit [Dehalococcoidia bacterium]